MVASVNSRFLVKRLVESALVQSGIPRWRVRTDPSGLAVLAYHNVVPEGEPTVGDRSAHITQEVFGRHLDVLAESHDFVSLSDAMLRSCGIPKRPLAVVTFDDAYTGAVTAGFTELKKRGIPATMFVPPGLLGTEGFWWDRVVRKGEESLHPEVRGFALGALQGRQDVIMNWATRENLEIRDLPLHARPSSAAELVSAARQANVALAPHSWSHPNLSTLSIEEAFDEVRRSKDWVKAAAVSSDDWFAYPYGLTNDRVARLLADEVSGALLVQGGLTRVRGRWQGKRTTLPRIPVPRGLTIDGLRLRVAGLISR